MAKKMRKNYTSSWVSFGASRVSKRVEAAGVALTDHTPHSDPMEHSQLFIVIDT
jgi:hypothetical protein